MKLEMLQIIFRCTKNVLKNANFSQHTVIVYMYDLRVILLKYYEMHIKLILIMFREKINTG